MTSPRRLFLLTLLAASVLPLPAQGAPQDFDVLISGGRIVDGTGNPWFFGDLGLRGGVIAALGDLDGATAPVQIDARGLVVAPGFIDPHVHGSISRGIDAPNFLIQGVTTLITGNDGSSPARIGAALEEATSNGMSPNVGLYIGHGTVRREVMGSADRHPNPEELRQMQALVAQAMGEGALGLSTGLAYVVNSLSKKSRSTIGFAHLSTGSSFVYDSGTRGGRYELSGL